MEKHHITIQISDVIHIHRLMVATTSPLLEGAKLSARNYINCIYLTIKAVIAA